MGNKCVKFLAGLAVGAAAGYVVGTLLAPKSGEETREDIKHKAQELAEKAQEKQEEALVAFQNTVIKGKEDVKHLSEKAVAGANVLKENVVENVHHLKENVTGKLGNDEIVEVKSFKDEVGI